jgi:hypothetical protein
MTWWYCAMAVDHASIMNIDHVRSCVIPNQFQTMSWVITRLLFCVTIKGNKSHPFENAIITVIIITSDMKQYILPWYLYWIILEVRYDILWYGTNHVNELVIWSILRLQDYDLAQANHRTVRLHVVVYNHYWEGGVGQWSMVRSLSFLGPAVMHHLPPVYATDNYYDASKWLLRLVSRYYWQYGHGPWYETRH